MPKKGERIGPTGNAVGNLKLRRIEHREAQRERQGNRCAVCGTELKLTKTILDHRRNHCSNPAGCRICWRGALCHRCNQGIGFFKESIELLQSAVSYLESWSKEEQCRVDE